jgi:hypothetical protein
MPSGSTKSKTGKAGAKAGTGKPSAAKIRGKLKKMATGKTSDVPF